MYKRRADGDTLAVALTAALLVAAAPASAQRASETVVVVGGGGAEQRALDAPFAVDIVGADTLRAAGPMVNLSESLGRVPGLIVNQRNNHAQDLQISSRGFGARAGFGVRGVRLYSDGIPAAGPDGQGQVSHFDLAGASRVEVLRGPFSALFGSSSGGVIATTSVAPQERSANVDADGGSFGLRQLRLGVAAPLDGGFSVAASASRFRIDGFRPHSAATRDLANVRLGFDAADDHAVLVINALDLPAQDPLGLTRAQLDADPDQTTPQATQFDTRKTTRQAQAGLSWQHRFDIGALQRGQLVAYSGQRSVTQWQAIAAATQANPRHPGGVIDFDRDYGGVDARLHWRWDALRAVTGVALDRQREARRGFENFTGAAAAQVLGVSGRLRRDERNHTRTTDGYAQAEADLAPTWAASAGVRSGRLDIDSRDAYLANGDDSGTLRFSYTLPVAALRWQPAPQWSLYASAGRGYEAPTLNELAYRPDGNSGFNTALRPQRSRQVELGVKWRGSDDARADLALFRADTSDEISTQSNSGGRSTFANVGRTLRQGAELALHARVAAQWQATIAATLLDARYRDAFLTCAGVPCAAPTLAVPAGNRIAGTVSKSGFAEVLWMPQPGVDAALELRGQARQPVNDVNSDAAGGYGLLALRGRWQLPAELMGAWRVELLGRVDNLADRRVAGSVIVAESNGRFFEPAPGRSVWLGVRVALMR